MFFKGEEIGSLCTVEQPSFLTVAKLDTVGYFLLSFGKLNKNGQYLIATLPNSLSIRKPDNSSRQWRNIWIIMFCSHVSYVDRKIRKPICMYFATSHFSVYLWRANQEPFFVESFPINSIKDLEDGYLRMPCFMSNYKRGWKPIILVKGATSYRVTHPVDWGVAS